MYPLIGQGHSDTTAIGKGAGKLICAGWRLSAVDSSLMAQQGI